MFEKIDKNAESLLQGCRMMRQDPVECLFQFICSSNNHISRIHGMVNHMCVAYGTKLEWEAGERLPQNRTFTLLSRAYNIMNSTLPNHGLLDTSARHEALAIFSNFQSFTTLRFSSAQTLWTTNSSLLQSDTSTCEPYHSCTMLRVTPWHALPGLCAL